MGNEGTITHLLIRIGIEMQNKHDNIGGIFSIHDKYTYWAETLTKARLLVAGDVMLDRYWFGQVDRISPEAPVPVIKVESSEERPGGAANVARNIAALGSQVNLLSVVGNDEAGEILRNCVENFGVKSFFQKDTRLPTTVKLRVISRQQQLIRIDFENEPQSLALDAKLQDYEQKLDQTDLVILSDYGKGALRYITNMIKSACDRNIPILVDPKGSDYERYRGATILTPNCAELSIVIGKWSNEAQLVDKVQQLRKHLELKAVLLTRSEEGMTLFIEGEVLYIPTQAREVYDVTGAGDTVIAVLGALMAAQMPLRQAVQWANRAAGIVVGKLGTAIVHPSELWNKEQ